MLFLKIKWFLFRERREIRRRFPDFLPYEKALRKAYRFTNPFSLCRRYGEVYGETPVPVLAQIAEECALNASDVIVDLGSGRGRGVFFLSHLLGCRARGVECIPLFTEKALAIAEAVKPALPVDFRCGKMENADFSEATVIYLYGTCLSDEAIHELAQAFQKLDNAIKIITVSYPLAEYSSQFRTVKQFSGSFPWGEVEIYLNQRRDDERT